VEKYTQSTLPFDLDRFIVGVGTTVHDRTVAERKIALNVSHHPLENRYLGSIPALGDPA
jgi:hypothetical protein